MCGPGLAGWRPPMANPRGMGARGLLVVLARASVTLACAACDSDPDAPSPGQVPTTVDADPASPELLDAEVGPVCPGCVSGGETSDFEGETHEECARFGLYTPVSDDVARELGFDVDGIRALLVRDFATSLRWTRLTPTPG